ncbi:28438_t:CDS:2, partial [Racocetra persica]
IDYNLFTVEIPIQPTDKDIVFRFVEALLTLRSSSNSSTVSSPRREGEQIKTRKINMDTLITLDTPALDITDDTSNSNVCQETKTQLEA